MQKPKDFYIKIVSIVAPAEHDQGNYKVTKDTVMAQGFEANKDWVVNATPSFATWNRKAYPGDEKAGIFWAYLSAVKYVANLYVKGKVKTNKDYQGVCFGVSLQLKTDNVFLYECETATGKLPYFKSKQAYAYHYYANQIIEESGLIVTWKLAGEPEAPKNDKVPDASPQTTKLAPGVQEMMDSMLEDRSEKTQKHGDTLEETEKFCHMVDNMKVEEPQERELSKEEQNTLDAVFDGIDKNTKNKV